MGVRNVLRGPRQPGRPSTQTALGQAHEAHRAMKVAQVYQGALVDLNGGAQSVPTASATAISWDNEIYDYYNVWASGAATRLSVPDGVTWVQLIGNVEFAANNTGVNRSVSIAKNGADINVSPATTVGPTTDKIRLNVASPELEVVGGTDYFELLVYHDRGSNLDVGPDYTWFFMKILE